MGRGKEVRIRKKKELRIFKEYYGMSNVKKILLWNVTLLYKNDNGETRAVSHTNVYYKSIAPCIVNA